MLLSFFPQSHGTFFENRTRSSKDVSFLDVADINTFRLLLERIRPDVVINCTGITKVDLCEQFPEKCWKLNSWQPLQIAQDCSARAIKYVHISTDHFLNVRDIKLKESDKAVPINHYGFSKLSAESFILAANRHSLVIRSNFFHFNLYSPKTFLDNLIDGVKKRKVFQKHKYPSIMIGVKLDIHLREIELYLREMLYLHSYRLLCAVHFSTRGKD